MPLTIKNQVFTTTLPDVDGNIMITCLTNPELSFTVNLGNDALNAEAIRHFDGIMLSSTTSEYRYEQARNPGPLLIENHIGSMKFTNVRYSFGIYWSNEANSDKVVVKDILGNKLLEKTGLSIGSQALRDFFLEYFPLRIRINTSSMNDQYNAIMTATTHHHAEIIRQTSISEIRTRTGMIPEIIQKVNAIIRQIRDEYHIDVSALEQHVARTRNQHEEVEEVPPPYSPQIIEEKPPPYNQSFA